MQGGCDSCMQIPEGCLIEKGVGICTTKERKTKTF